jgi:dTDP-glucose 4,6-dehydratase
MRILVTGGFGFIGSHYVERAVKLGHEVHVLDKFTYAADLENISPKIRENIKFTKFDISHKEIFVSGELAKEEFDLIVNFAAESHVDRSISDSHPFLESNVTGTVNLLEYLKSGNAKKMIQVSTDEVYGTIELGSWDENCALNPRSPYSASKASAEFFCMSYVNTHNLNITITRSANNFGPKQSVEKLIPKTLRNAIQGKKIPVYGDGQQEREWIPVAEHAEFLIELGNLDLNKLNVFNLGGVPLKNIQLIEKILASLNLSNDLIEFVPDRLGHDRRYSVDDRKLRNLVKIDTHFNFDAEINSTIEWYGLNSDWSMRSEERLKR